MHLIFHRNQYFPGQSQSDFDLLNFQPGKILGRYLSFTGIQEYQAKIPFKCTTTRSEPECDSYLILNFQECKLLSNSLM